MFMSIVMHHIVYVLIIGLEGEAAQAPPILRTLRTCVPTHNGVDRHDRHVASTWGREQNNEPCSNIPLQNAEGRTVGLSYASLRTNGSLMNKSVNSLLRDQHESYSNTHVHYSIHRNDFDSRCEAYMPQQRES